MSLESQDLKAGSLRMLLKFSRPKAFIIKDSYSLIRSFCSSLISTPGFAESRDSTTSSGNRSRGLYFLYRRFFQQIHLSHKILEHTTCTANDVPISKIVKLARAILVRPNNYLFGLSIYTFNNRRCGNHCVNTFFLLKSLTCIWLNDLCILPLCTPIPLSLNLHSENLRP